jgi:hypothetical protein
LPFRVKEHYFSIGPDKIWDLELLVLRPYNQLSRVLWVRLDLAALKDCSSLP